jgi:hypothetical protein
MLTNAAESNVMERHDEPGQMTESPANRDILDTRRYGPSWREENQLF